MGFREENEVFEEIILQMGKEMLAEGEDAFIFAKLLEVKDFKNAYTMLSESQKEKCTVEEFEKFSTEDPVDLNPAPKNFQEEQMPYKKVAIDFATFLVHKEYIKAFDMLTEEQKKEYSEESLQNEMMRMTDYFENSDKIWVETKFVEDEGAIDDKCIYVPIEEDGNSEAVCVDIVFENEKLLIGNIEWGRP